MTRLRPVVAGGDLDDQLGLVALRQPDDAAAEARSGQARAHRARLDERRRQGVELRRRDLEVVAEAAVAFVQQRAERGDVPLRQRRGRLEHTGVLGDDVPGPRLVGDLLRRRRAGP